MPVIYVENWSHDYTSKEKDKKGNLSTFSLLIVKMDIYCGTSKTGKVDQNYGIDGVQFLLDIINDISTTL